MRHLRSVVQSLALVAFLPAAFAADVLPPSDPRSDDAPSPPPPVVIEDIRYAADIAPGTAEFEVLPAAAQALLLANPNAQAAVIDGRVAAFYGAPLATGATAEDAEQAFWAAHRDAFGISNLDLTVTRAHEVGFGRLAVFAYQQRIDGLPIEYATARLTVDPSDGHAVTLVSGRFVHASIDGLSDVFITPESAIGIVAASPSFSYFQHWSTPELVVFAGTPESFGWPRATHPVKAWKIQADFEAEQTPFQAVTFFVDAASGEIVAVTRDTANFDLIGRVRARATPVEVNQQPWSGPYDPGDPSTLDDDISVPQVLVRVSPGGTPNDLTDFSGDFAVPWTGGGTTMTVTLDDGEWFDLEPASGSPLSDSETVAPNQSADFFLNETSWTQETVGQANALIYAALSRRFFTDRMTFAGLNYRLRLVTSDPGDVCNSFYSRDTLRFYHAGTNELGHFCPDYAFSAFVTHEYGHFVHNQLGAFGAAFGEGFGDASALLLYDDPNLNRGGALGRDYSPRQTEHSYPSKEGEPHTDGMVLAGLWRDIREQLSQAPLTDAEALTFTRDLFVDWAQLTNGGYGTQSGHPLTMKEILVAAQALCTSPNYNYNYVSLIKPRICEAARLHGLATLKQLFPPGSGAICAITAPPANLGPFVSFRTPQITYLKQPNGSSYGVNPYGMAVGTVDSDSLNDVVLACESSGNVLIYWGASSSAGSYEFYADPTSSTYTPTSVATAINGRPTKVAIADLNNDGLKDIVVTLSGTTGLGLQQVQILRNDGNRAFTPLTPMTPIDASSRTVLRPIGVVAGDWDADNDLDIAVAGYVEDGTLRRATLALFWNSGGFSFARTGMQAPDPDSTNFPNVNARGTGYDLAYWTEDSSGGPGTTFNMLAMTNNAGVADNPRPALHIFRGAVGSQTLTARSFPGDVSESLTRIPVDNDVLIDIATTNNTSPAFSADTDWFRRTSSTAFALQSNASDFAITDVMPRSVAAGQITKVTTSGGGLTLDSRSDLVVATTTTSLTNYEWQIAVFENSGAAPPAARFLQNQVAVSPNPYDRPFPRQVLVFDINADGLPDILTANRGLSSGTSDAFEGFSLLLNRGQQP
jgi:hypothetical protein